MAKMLRIVVNADDFGLSVEVTDEIVRCIESGAVTSTTVMATAPDFRRSVDLARKYPAVSFGVHLNATEFAPISGDKRLEPLLVDGAFDGANQAGWRRPAVLRGLLAEFSAQYETVAEFLPVSHVDSHHMVHWTPELAPVVTALVRRHRIPSIRTVTRHGVSGVLAMKRGVWRLGVERLSGAKMTDDFAGLDEFMRDPGRWGVSAASIEVMVHPGHPGYAAESLLLERSWWHEASRPVELVSYHQI